jgi:hypothetical protein
MASAAAVQRTWGCIGVMMRCAVIDGIVEIVAKTIS